MTPEEAKEELLKIIEDNWDKEGAHARADDVLCEVLINLGYSDIVELWNQVDKWYA